MRAAAPRNVFSYCAAFSLLACLLLNVFSARIRPSPWPLRQSLSAQSAVETAALLSLGMRRLAADMGLVRLLIYYGSPETAHEESGTHGHEHEAFEAEHPERSWGGGSYGELGLRALRIMDLDPSMSYVALYASGALAFNLNRPMEALHVLRYALARDPRNIQYQAYVAAIGFHRHGDPAGVIHILEPVLDTPECPAMVKHMVAYLYVKTGQSQKAARLYKHILETSKDAGYRRMARAALARLNAAPAKNLRRRP
ncbi:MAG TPA: hypothetical protein DEB40_08485 [Elusimicrobia bacterium]|nr:hypothetical protein [Elusimicrobiota bacterium]HBT61764.1 hypothetical protein [Elusimicrobiota bacterium]